MFRQLLGLSLPVYVLFVVGLGFVLTTANSLTKQEGRLTFYAEIYSILLYMTSIAALLWLEFYVISGRFSLHHHKENGVTSGKSPGAEYEMTAEKDDSREKLAGKPHHRKRGANFYFLLGGIVFALGAVLHDIFYIVDFAVYGAKSCLHPVDVVKSVMQALLIVMMAVFIVRRHKVIVNKDTLGIRFLFVHVISTNICVWINSSINEAAEDFRHDRVEQTADKDLDSNTTSSSCYSDRELRTLSSPYLTPCRIEFSLFAIAILYQVMSHVQDQKENHETQNEATYKEGRHIKLLRMARTLHVGAIIVIGTLVAIGVFFNYSESLGDAETAQFVFHGTEISLLLILIASLIVGFISVRELRFVPKQGASFDENLLMVAVLGQILYDVSRLLASVDGLSSAQPTAEFSLVASLLSVAELYLQTVFILYTCRLCAESDQHESEKPGRAAIGFVLLANLSMWILVTFEAKKTTMVGMYIEFYGYLPWALISYTLTPMLIFYRFHSTVLLSDIWKEAYEKGKFH